MIIEEYIPLNQYLACFHDLIQYRTQIQMGKGISLPLSPCYE